MDGSFDGAQNTSLADTPVGPDLPQLWISVGDEAKANFTVDESSLWRAIDRSDKLVVKKWRTHGQLGPFECVLTVMVPGNLAGQREGDWMQLGQRVVRDTRLSDVGC